MEGNAGLVKQISSKTERKIKKKTTLHTNLSEHGSSYIQGLKKQEEGKVIDEKEEDVDQTEEHSYQSLFAYRVFLDLCKMKQLEGVEEQRFVF